MALRTPRPHTLDAHPRAEGEVLSPDPALGDGHAHHHEPEAEPPLRDRDRHDHS